MQSCEFVKRVQAASRLLKACKGSRAFEAADKAQRTALSAVANNELLTDADGAAEPQCVGADTRRDGSTCQGK